MAEATTAPTADDLDALFGDDDGDTQQPAVERPEIPEACLADKPKKGDIVAYLQALVDTDHLTVDEFKELKALKVGELVPRFKAMFGTDEMTSPETVGFDPNDQICQVVARVEQLTETEAQLRITELSQQADGNRFEIGGILARAQAEGWTGDHEDFFDHALATFGYQRRDTQRLMQIYRCLTSCGCTWDEIKHLGWSAISYIASLLTPENYQEVIQAVEGMGYDAIIEWAKDYRAQLNGGGAEGGEGEGAGGADDVTRWNAKLYDDDMREIVELASEQITEESGTKDNGHILKLLCQNYLSGGAEAPAPKTKAELSAQVSTLLKRAKAAGVTGTEFEDAVLSSVGEQIEGDLDHWPDGLPEVSEGDFLRDLYAKAVNDLVDLGELIEARLDEIGEDLEAGED